MNDLQKENDHLKDLIKQFFYFLDYTTGNDDETKEYRPVSINCSQSLLIPKLDKLLHDMKKSIE